jgi:hypothetical protein
LFRNIVASRSPRTLQIVADVKRTFALRAQRLRYSSADLSLAARALQMRYGWHFFTITDDSEATKIRPEESTKNFVVGNEALMFTRALPTPRP